MNKVGLRYNAQIAVTEIADEPTDHKQLPVIGAQAAEILKNPRLKMVVDAGYHDQEAEAKAGSKGWRAMWQINESDKIQLAPGAHADLKSWPLFAWPITLSPVPSLASVTILFPS